jgi:integrase
MRPEGSNPCSKIERYPENHRERFLSAEELARLGATLRQAESIGLPAPIAKNDGHRRLFRRVTTAAIELLLFTGCRLSEVLNLRWEQVDFAVGIITLLETKSGNPQVVTMNAPARQVLKELEAGAAPRPAAYGWHPCGPVRRQRLPRARSLAPQEPGDDRPVRKPGRQSGAHLERAGRRADFRGHRRLAPGGSGAVEGRKIRWSLKSSLRPLKKEPRQTGCRNSETWGKQRDSFARAP